ncbi:hypothetical protein A8W25_03250 [Streptomyces sp. ERV7]|nr:hypothetical protein A8W25_03250 [Streptomyces sp. ERV7]
MRGEHPLDRVEGAGEDPDRALRHSVGVQRRAREPRQLRVHRVLPVQRGPFGVLAGGGRQRVAERRQQGGVGVAVGEVAHADGHVDALGVQGGAGRARTDPAAPAPPGLDDAPVPQQPVGGRDRIGIHSELGRQLPHRRQQLPRLQLPRAHRALHIGGDLRCAPPHDPILS